MRRPSLLLLMLAVAGAGAACRPVDPHEDPAATPTPSATPTAAAPAHSIVWVDATGAVATDIVHAGVETLYYFDATGLVWSLSPRTGEVNTVFATNAIVYYDQADCAGSGYLLETQVPAARLTFLSNAAADDVIRVRPDDVVGDDVVTASTLNVAGTCTNVDNEDYMIALSAMEPSTPLDYPELEYTPPLHPELR